MQNLMKSSEVMESLSVCKTTFWKLVNDGEIPVVTIGRAKRFRPDDVERFIQSNTQGRPSEVQSPTPREVEETVDMLCRFIDSTSPSAETLIQRLLDERAA